MLLYPSKILSAQRVREASSLKTRTSFSFPTNF
uniref:Uncharacterized protein n=1 Tax=Lepeophtheirus salmonis TaxID=72036 RepID=A0A0K2U9D6_LEPSM